MGELTDNGGKPAEWKAKKELLCLEILPLPLFEGTTEAHAQYKQSLKCFDFYVKCLYPFTMGARPDVEQYERLTFVRWA